VIRIAKRYLKKQSQFVPESEPVQTIPKACGFEAATRPLWLRGDLKKQSQFRQSRLINWRKWT